MTTLESLQKKIEASSSFTELSESITDQERALLTQGLSLFQPNPFLLREKGEHRFYGVDKHGVVRATDCNPAAMGQVWGYIPAGDDAILDRLLQQDREIESGTHEVPVNVRG
jgi:hypothetical protein